MTERAIGIMLPRDLPADQFRPYAQRAEALGFDELWVVEDCFFRGGIAQAAAALAMTERIRVGIGILPAAVRNAAFTAMEAATLAELFPGRVDIGIGHGMPGWMRQVGAWPASPLTMLERAPGRGAVPLLRGGAVDADGRYVTLDGVELNTPPSTRAAGARRGARAEVARARGPVRRRHGPGGAGHPRVRRGGAASTSRRRGAPDRRLLRRRRRRRRRPGPRRGPARAGVDRGARLGRAHRPAAVRRRVPRAARVVGERPAAFAAAMPDEWVDQLAVVGTVDGARTRIGQLHDAGVTTTVLIPAGPDPLAALEDLARVL